MDNLVGTTLGPYKLLDKIGEGGFAAVYRATHLILQQPRAIKVLSLPQRLNHDARFLALFRREAQLAASLEHPNIVRVYDVGEQDYLHYIAMELLIGKSLQQVIREDRPISLIRISKILQQLSSAIAYAHSHGIVHRDIKPQNVFISPDDHVTLMDFGIGRGNQSTTLGITEYAGTREYMPPEALDYQGDAEPSQKFENSVSADIYATGVLTFQLLTGSLPFFRSIDKYDEPPAITITRPDIHEYINQVMSRCLSPSVSHRYTSVDSFSAEVISILRLSENLDQIQILIDEDDIEKASQILESIPKHLVSNGSRGIRYIRLSNELTSIRHLSLAKDLIMSGSHDEALRLLMSSEQKERDDYVAMINLCEQMLTRDAASQTFQPNSQSSQDSFTRTLSRHTLQAAALITAGYVIYEITSWFILNYYRIALFMK